VVAVCVVASVALHVLATFDGSVCWSLRGMAVHSGAVSEKLLAREKQLMEECEARIVTAREGGVTSLRAECDARVTSATSVAVAAVQTECDGKVKLAMLEKEKEERERCGAREKDMLAMEKQRESGREEMERAREKTRTEETRREREQWVREKEEEMALLRQASEQAHAKWELKMQECERQKAEQAAAVLEREKDAAEAAAARLNASVCEAHLLEEVARCDKAVEEVCVKWVALCAAVICRTAPRKHTRVRGREQSDPARPSLV